MVGAEFSADGASRKKSAAEMVGKKLPSLSNLEVMDPAIARHTAKTLQAVLLEKPTSKTGLYSNLRCSATELLGRGFNLWEKYVDIPLVIMGLLDLAVQYTPSAPGTEEGKAKKNSTKAMKFVSDVAKKALNLMVLLRPSTVVTTLAKEVGMFISSQHITPSLHSNLPPVQVCLSADYVWSILSTAVVGHTHAHRVSNVPITAFLIVESKSLCTRQVDSSITRFVRLWL